MRRLDRDEADTKGAVPSRPTRAEAAGYLRDPAQLWDDADGSGRKLLAAALFDRIEVLGAQRVNLHPSPSATAQGWAEAWNGLDWLLWSGREDLNLRPHRPERCALPSCATPRPREPV